MTLYDFFCRELLLLNSGWTRRVNLNSETTTSFLIMCVYLQTAGDACVCFFTFSLDSSIIEWRLSEE